MTLAIVVAICLVATLVRSTFGFGESLVAVPLLALVVPLEVAVPLSVMLSVLVAAIAIVQDREQTQLASAAWLVGSSLVGIPVGLAVLVYANPTVTRVVLGSVIVAYGAYSLVVQPRVHLARDHRAWLVACGIVSGVLGGAYGLNGPPLVVYGNLRRWTPQQFRATLQAYFLPASMIGLAGYALRGLVDARVVRMFALTLPATLPAVFVGRWLNGRFSATSFFRYVFAGLIAIGATLVAVTLA